MSTLAEQKTRSAIRIVRIPNGVVVTGVGFYSSLVVTQPGIILIHVEGKTPVATVAPQVAVIEAEAARTGPVFLVTDCERAMGEEPGLREAWLEPLLRVPPIVRASHVLVTSLMPTMSVHVMRMATGSLLTSYGTRAEFERGVHAVEPTIDLDRFEKRAGR